MNLDIVVKKKGAVYEATAFDESGEKVDSLVAFTASNARRLLKEKLGLGSGNKPKKKKKRGPRPTLYDSGSVMSGLRGVTTSRPWKKTK
ncbi:hypothetical protein [Franzmannia pantelleriensis]|uniref:hypothetical protein n=1 Tax=Franzmannia pantelleriensis TaxID=48727 RepID=UPI00115FDB24|nr:hypothetical protein [Halomonas pantelleriensis]